MQYKDPVAQQYERWSYPRTIERLDRQLCKHYLIDSHAFWPTRDQLGKVEILIAGCGTNEAACVAYHNPTAQVVGIDVSASSLEHERYLKRLYSLDNLTLHQLAIEEVATLDCDFDFIFAHGVIHHLQNPTYGLNALRNVLRRDGSIHIMLYGKYGRLGLNMLQTLFRQLGVEQTEADIELVKAALDYLPAAHPANWIKSTQDVQYSGGLVDALLHKHEVTFTVDDCLDLLERCELQFQGWESNKEYYPDAHLPRTHPLYRKINLLSELEIWRAMELWLGTSKQLFTACRKERPRSSFLIDFDGKDFMRYIPIKRHDRLLEYGLSQVMSLDGLEVHLFNLFDGHKTVQQCLDKSRFGVNPNAMERKARNLIRHLWRAGLLYIQIPAP